MTRPLAIGKLDRQITIQKLLQSQGGTYGEPTESWADWATVWANVYYGGGREFERARQITAEIDTQFQIHYIAGLKRTMRVNYENRIYDIQRIDEVGRRKRWNIWAKAKEE